MRLTLTCLLTAGLLNAHADTSTPIGSHEAPSVTQPTNTSPLTANPTPPASQHIESIPDEIKGKCETSTGGAIPFIVPCRNLDLILMRDKTHEVARTNLNPQGEFVFGGLKMGVYALVVRSTKQKYESRMEGLKPGNIYTISPEIPEKK